MKEKILKSLNSGDLSDEEWENAAHVVASLGAAQIGNRKHLNVGAMLLHIRAGHVQFVPKLLGIVTLTIVSKARKEHWHGVTADRAATLAQVALDHFLDPNCPVCNGVGRIGEFGKVIVMCSRKNGGCGGSGKREFKFRGWMEHVRDVLGMLERYEGQASGSTRQQARGGRDD